MKFVPLRRAARARWTLWLGAWLVPVCALAQAPEPAASPPEDATDSAVTTARSGRTRAPAEPRFDVEVQTSDALRAFVLRHMELMRFRELRDLDAAELSRLLSLAPENLLDLLGTLGYFSPEIQIDEPVNSGPTPLGTVRIRIEPGPITRVAQAQLDFRGDIASNPQAAEQREAIQKAWTLKPGQSFTQADWSSAKTAALRVLTSQRYPAGRVYNSLADVDPHDHSVRLFVELDSGNPLRFGELRVEGVERYERDMVERLVRLAGVSPGAIYDLTQLQNAQQRVADSGYFQSVYVSVDPSGEPPSAPVLVQVREGPLQKLVLGVGGSTDNGARLSVEHTHHRVPGIGWRALSKLHLERDDKLASTDWSAPVDDKGWRWIVSALMARQIDGFDTTTSQRLRLGQAQANPALDRSFFLQYDRAQVDNSVLKALGTAQTQASLTANYAWTYRRFDSTPFPSSGYGVGVELGLGTTLQGQRQPFGRTQVRWLSYWPLGGNQSAELNNTPLGVARPASTEARAASRLALRLEGGAVWARANTPVPETQLFLTGGDTTVRGYGLRDIGLPQADGGVAPGRTLAVASVEWQRPIWRNGVRSPWESVLFIDGGAVANKAADLKPRWGLGAGVRYNSPVGPLRLDLAYGVKSKTLRMHFNVGFSF